MANTNSSLPYALSHIEKLNYDVLWKILWHNTDMFEEPQVPNFNEVNHENQNDADKPLGRLRRMSQVCRLWREIIIGSSAFWGRVIDLNLLLGERRARWRSEVISRAAQASLHIMGTINIDSEDSKIFLGNLLDERWVSIEKFVVCVVRDSNSAELNPSIWHPLQRPAPILHTFKLFLRGRDSPIISGTNPCLFGNEAPSLRLFTIFLLPEVHFSPQMPWLRQLRSLELATTTRCIDAYDFLIGLSNMPHLECLKIGGVIYEPLATTDPQIVSLKSLTRLRVAGTFRASLFLIKHIIPSATCVLGLAIRNPSGLDYDLSDVEIQDMSQAITRYTKGYPTEEQKQVRSLAFILLEDNITLTSPELSINLATEVQFYTGFRMRDLLSSSPASSLFSIILNPRFFPHIETFQLLFNSNIVLDAHQLDILGTFLSSLSSATDLKILSPNAFVQVVEVEGRNPEIFPVLQTITIKRFSPSLPNFISRFLERRIQRGRPVSTLVLLDTELQINSILGKLKGFQGLNVVWRDQRYLCDQAISSTEGA